MTCITLFTLTMSSRFRRRPVWWMSLFWRLAWGCGCLAQARSSVLGGAGPCESCRCGHRWPFREGEQRDHHQIRMIEKFRKWGPSFSYDFQKQKLHKGIKNDIFGIYVCWFLVCFVISQPSSFKSSFLFNKKIASKFIGFCQYLDKLSPPLTLPSGVTLPPAASIRFISGSSSGLCQASSLST